MCRFVMHKKLKCFLNLTYPVSTVYKLNAFDTTGPSKLRTACSWKEQA